MIATFFTKIFFIFYRLLKLIGVSFYMLIKAGYYHYFRNGQSDRLPVIFRRYFEVLGGGFIKVGQTLSMRYDVFPDEYCNELSGLLDDVKPFDRKRGLRIIKKEWKGRLGDFLQNEELELVASASLGQVYLGTNKSGDKVAIKIKRPYITPIILADLFYLEFLSFLFFLTGYGAKVGVTDILKELIEALKSEVNYKKETLVMETFHALSNEEKLFRSPKVYSDYCTNSVICMEFFEGIWLSEILDHIRNGTLEDLRSLRKFDHSLSDLSERIFEILMYQIYDHSFFHADPHAGNIILLPTGQIGLVDFGIAGVFSKEDKRKQLDYLVALSVGDLDQAIDSFVNILEPTDQSNYTEIKQDFRVYLLKWIHANKSESKRTFEKTSGFLIMNSTALVKKYNFKFPKNILLYYKSVFILEHIIFELNPAFDTVAQTSTFLEGNLKRSMQKKISLETSYYRQFNLIENFLNLDKTISNFFNSKDSAPHPKRIGNMPMVLRFGILLVVFLLILKGLPVTFESDVLTKIHGIGVGWLVVSGLILTIYARRYFT